MDTGEQKYPDNGSQVVRMERNRRNNQPSQAENQLYKNVCPHMEDAARNTDSELPELIKHMQDLAVINAQLLRHLDQLLCQYMNFRGLYGDDDPERVEAACENVYYKQLQTVWEMGGITCEEDEDGYLITFRVNLSEEKTQYLAYITFKNGSWKITRNTLPLFIPIEKCCNVINTSTAPRQIARNVMRFLTAWVNRHRQIQSIQALHADIIGNIESTKCYQFVRIIFRHVSEDLPLPRMLTLNYGLQNERPHRGQLVCLEESMSPQRQKAMQDDILLHPLDDIFTAYLKSGPS